MYSKILVHSKPFFSTVKTPGNANPMGSTNGIYSIEGQVIANIDVLPNLWLVDEPHSGVLPQLGLHHGAILEVVLNPNGKLFHIFRTVEIRLDGKGPGFADPLEDRASKILEILATSKI